MTQESGGASASNVKQQLGNSASLLGALDAASNWPAFLLLSITFILSLICAVVLGAVTAFFVQKSATLAGLFGLIAFLVVAAVTLIGLNATGILLADGVWGRTQRSMTNAVLASAFTFHRLLAVLLIEFLCFVAFLIVLALVLVVCKIPGLGPALFALVLPVGAICAGLVFFALVYIGIPMAAPGIWTGATVKRTLLMLQAIARKRLLMAVTMMVLLGILTFFAMAFVWFILSMGTLTVFSMSGVVLGVSGSGMGGLNNIMSIVNGGGASGYAYATGFGGALLLLVGANPGVLIALKGTSIVYREVSAGISLESDEKALDARVQDIKARAEQMRQQAHATAQHHMTSPLPAASVGSAMACPACGAGITAQDVFCGGCGHKLSKAGA